MGDIVLLAEAVLVGTLVAAVIMALAGGLARRSWQRSACWSWAIGAGVLAASGATDQWPHWPPLEDRARFLTLLVPLVVAVETLATAIRSRRVAWIVRVALAASVAPILLFNTVYLADLNGPGSAQWSPAVATLALCGLAALLLLAWATMNGLASRTSTQTVEWLLAIDALATAVTVMLSGYYRGGVLGLGLAGSIAGTALASRIVGPQAHARGSLAMSVIGIFSVVLVGRFFGSLPTSLAACLLLAPVLAWIFELPRLRDLPPAWRSAGRIACVVVPLALAVVIARREFNAASTSRIRSAEPSQAISPMQR